MSDESPKYNFPLLTGIEHGQGPGQLTGSGLVRDKATGSSTRDWMLHVGTPAVWFEEDGVKGLFYDSSKVVP